MGGLRHTEATLSRRKEDPRRDGPPNAVRHDWPRRELTAVLEDLPAPPIRTGGGRYGDPRRLGGAGQPGRVEDVGVRVLAVRARDDAVGHPAGAPDSLERLEDLMEHLAGPEVRLP